MALNLLAPLAAVLFGGGLGRLMQQAQGQSAAGAQRERYKQGVAAAMGPTTETVNPLTGEPMSPETFPGFDPTASTANARRFGLNLLGNKDTSAEGLSIFNSAGSQGVQEAGQAETARSNRASLQETIQNRLMQQQNQIETLRRTLDSTLKGEAKDRASAIAGLRNDLDPIVGPVVMAGNMLGAGAQAPAGYAGDQQIIYGIAKLLDPVGPLNDSTVQSVAGNPSLSALGERLFGKYLDGQTLRPEERADLLQVGATLYQQQKKGAMAMAAPILTTAERMQLPRDEIFNPGVLLGDEQVAKLLARGGQGPTVADDGPAVDGPELRAANSRLAKQGLPAVRVGETKAEYEARTK